MNNSKPLVSIIIPTFGRPDFIERAIKSAINQTYSNTEIIVVDDNGEGNENQLLTKSKVEPYMCRKNFIYCTYEKNMNGSFARNYGARISKGEFLCFLDDDDEFANTKVERQLEAILSSNYGACYCGHIRKNLINNKETIYKPETFGDIRKNAVFNDVDFCFGSTLMIKREIFEEIGGFDVKLTRFQDYNLAVKISFNTMMSLVSSPETIIYTHNGSNKPKKFEAIEKARVDYFVSVIGYVNRLDKKDFRKFKFLHNYFLLKEAFKKKIFLKTLKYFFKCKNPFSIVKQFVVERRGLKNNEKCNITCI